MDHEHGQREYHPARFLFRQILFRLLHQIISQHPHWYHALGQNSPLLISPLYCSFQTHFTQSDIRSTSNNECNNTHRQR